jgi:hypothetical protein
MINEMEKKMLTSTKVAFHNLARTSMIEATFASTTSNRQTTVKHLAVFSWHPWIQQIYA